MTEKSIVGYGVSTKVTLYAGFGVVGLVLGYFLPRIATWALTLKWIPFQGPIELINSFRGPWLDVVLALVGLIAGLSIAYIAIKESLVTMITDQAVQLYKDGHNQAIGRKDIDAVFLDGKQLVIVGVSGHELAREKYEEKPEDMAYAFNQHGYPWSAEGDPYKDQFRRWVADMPDLSAAANALMKAREKALKEKNAEEIKDLRRELAKLDIIVRDEGFRQYWRNVGKIRTE